VCYDADCTPYGQGILHANTCQPSYKFTGYERDSETGLDYAMFRYYNGRTGRFMSF
jgi:RHS repeat-associated protein